MSLQSHVLQQVCDIKVTLNYEMYLEGNSSDCIDSVESKSSVAQKSPQKQFFGDSLELQRQLDSMKAKITMCQQCLLDHHEGSPLNEEELLTMYSSIRSDIESSLSSWAQSNKTLLKTLHKEEEPQVVAATITATMESQPESLGELISQDNKLRDPNVEQIFEAYTGPKDSDAEKDTGTKRKTRQERIAEKKKAKNDLEETALDDLERIRVLVELKDVLDNRKTQQQKLQCVNNSVL